MGAGRAFSITREKRTLEANSEGRADPRTIYVVLIRGDMGELKPARETKSAASSRARAKPQSHANARCVGACLLQHRRPFEPERSRRGKRVRRNHFASIGARELALHLDARNRAAIAHQEPGRRPGHLVPTCR